MPIDPETGALEPADITLQAQRIMKNVEAVLAEAGLTQENVVKTTCFLSDMANFAPFNAVYGAYFTSKPARSCVAVRELPKQLLCEIEVIAVAE
jgi:2-iminobutanoate/2-iminopropanoate deaminase